MSTIITYHRLPDATHFRLKLDHKIHHLAFFGLVKVPFAREFSQRSGVRFFANRESLFL